MRSLTRNFSLLLILILVISILEIAKPALAQTSSSAPAPSLTLTSTCAVTFVESGLPSGTLWESIFNRTQHFSNNDTITVNNISAGNYSWSIPTTVALNMYEGTGTVYSASPSSGTTSISSFGSQSLLQITFSPSPTLSPSPTPTVPKFSSWVILPILIIVIAVSLLLYKRHRKNANKKQWAPFPTSGCTHSLYLINKIF